MQIRERKKLSKSVEIESVLSLGSTNISGELFDNLTLWNAFKGREERQKTGDL